MDGAIGFFLGVFTGGVFGVFAMALLTAAKWQDGQFTGNGRWEDGNNDPGRDGWR